jgi:transposase-like protein
VYTREFKAGVVVPAEKREKPVRHIAQDPDINGNQLYRWIQRAREAMGTGLPPFPGPGMRNYPGCGRKTKR